MVVQLNVQQTFVRRSLPRSIYYMLKDLWNGRCLWHCGVMLFKQACCWHASHVVARTSTQYWTSRQPLLRSWTTLSSTPSWCSSVRSRKLQSKNCARNWRSLMRKRRKSLESFTTELSRCRGDTTTSSQVGFGGCPDKWKFAEKAIENLGKSGLTFRWEVTRRLLWAGIANVLVTVFFSMFHKTVN